MMKIILCGIQGHPHERLHQPTNQHASSPDGRTDAGEKDASHGITVRKSQISDNKTRVNNSVVESNRSIDSDGRIIFPSDSLPYTVEPPKLIMSSVPACKNTTFCENPLFYPKDFIKSSIKKREDLKYLAVVDTVPEIGQRVDPGNDDSLCTYEDIVVFPKSAENKAKQWLYIINEDNFPQGVRIESCIKANAACRIIEGLLSGYETSCKQKFVYRQLAAITTEGSVGADFFRFPASCCCHVKFTGNPASRFGIDLDKSRPQSPAPRTAVSRTDQKSSARRK